MKLRSTLAVLFASATIMAVSAAFATIATAAGTGADTPSPDTSSGSDAAMVGIANPAAVFCIKSGGDHVIRKTADGSEYGVCVFPDGHEVDAWEYFRSHAPKN